MFRYQSYLYMSVCRPGRHRGLVLFLKLLVLGTWQVLGWEKNIIHESGELRRLVSSDRRQSQENTDRHR